MSKQITTAGTPDDNVARFGNDLSLLRQRAGKSYGVIAKSRHFSKSAVYGACQGRHLPSAALVRAIVEECGDDPETWVARRNSLAKATASEAKGAIHRSSARDQGVDPPNPLDATTPAEYNAALDRLREWSGLTYRDIGVIAKEYPRPLAASTLCSALKRTTLPGRRIVTSFMRAVGLDDQQQAVWLEVWHALNARKQPARSVGAAFGDEPSESERPSEGVTPTSAAGDTTDSGQSVALIKQAPSRASSRNDAADEKRRGLRGVPRTSFDWSAMSAGQRAVVVAAILVMVLIMLYLMRPTSGG
ncbi:helix-turn-helix domain-containing protein [Plantactinospora solaniradicis]|uniref:Helix-turn-helix domain-containing protein n=1 Tax=Plantactinospora solaniradicis TaxID=1723736 RepID=A0ABW1KJR6_9ACTN